MKRISKSDLCNEYFRLMQNEGRQSDNQLFAVVRMGYLASGALMVWTTYNSYGARKISEATSKSLNTKRMMKDALSTRDWIYYLDDIRKTIQDTKNQIKNRFTPMVSGI